MPSFELPIRTALDGEVLSIDLISSLPVPVPMPALQTPRLFKNIGEDIIDARSWSLIASLPVPVPGPNNAIAAQNRALHHLELLEDKINQAEENGWITADDAEELLYYQSDLVSLVGSLPVPVP